MKLRQLECLCCVVDAGFNISHAANVLHATQPAVAKQLRQFEEELGVTLLLRQGGRPVALTPIGERTVQWARRALQCALNIAAVVREGDGAEGGTITLATSHAHANYVLLEPISSFSHRWPKVHLHVLQGSPFKVAELVNEGKVTVGITHLPPEFPRDVVAVPFLTSPRLVIAPVGHPVLRDQGLTLSELARYPLIVSQSSRPQGARIVRRFREAGLAVTPTVYALDMGVIKTYVAAGMGIGIIPAFCYSEQDDAGLGARSVAHLFEPAISAVLLRRLTHLPAYVYRLLEAIDPALQQCRIEPLVLQDGDA